VEWGLIEKLPWYKDGFNKNELTRVHSLYRSVYIYLYLWLTAQVEWEADLYKDGFNKDGFTRVLYIHLSKKTDSRGRTVAEG